MTNQADVEQRAQGRHAGARPTAALSFVIFWTVLSTFNFGFGTSELNPLQHVISCPSSSASPASQSALLPLCLPLTSSQFGYITAAFTIGGFLASLSLSPLKSRIAILRRSRNVLLMAAVCNVLGGLVQMVAATWKVLAVGRFVMGLGSGVAVAVVPSYLNDISPAHLKGSIGVLNQLSIVVGILCAQSLGVSPLGQAPVQPSIGGRPSRADAPWRYVPLISAAFALLQIVLFPFALDSPSDLEGEARRHVERRLWGTGFAEQPSQEAEALLGEADADSGSQSAAVGPPSKPLTIMDLLTLIVKPYSVSVAMQVAPRERKALQRGTLLIIFTQMAQQLSGVNAVLYFSTGILSDVFQGQGRGDGDGDKMAKQIGLAITLVNTLMTFPPIPLIRESLLGRKRLLQLSSATMSLSALALSFALLTSRSVLAAISIVIFVAGFSIGLGPIPFLILPELVPQKAIPAASSLGISLNWLSNIIVASLFLPLKNTLADIDGSKGGSIFLVFVLINALSFAGVSRYYSYQPSAV